MIRVSRTGRRRNPSHSPLVVIRQGGKGNVVMIAAAAAFVGWQETVHRLGSPRNAG